MKLTRSIIGAISLSIITPSTIQAAKIEVWNKTTKDLYAKYIPYVDYPAELSNLTLIAKAINEKGDGGGRMTAELTGMTGPQKGRPLLVVSESKDPKTLEEVKAYEFTPGKDILVRFKQDGDTLIFSEQTGPLIGATGQTKSGISRKNNVTKADIFQGAADNKGLFFKDSLLKAVATNNLENVKAAVKASPIGAHADFINAGASTRLNKGYTALHHAVLYGNKDIIHYLLSLGANPEAKTWDGYSPISIATQEMEAATAKNDLARAAVFQEILSMFSKK